MKLSYARFNRAVSHSPSSGTFQLGYTSSPTTTISRLGPEFSKEADEFVSLVRQHARGGGSFFDHGSIVLSHLVHSKRCFTGTSPDKPYPSKLEMMVVSSSILANVTSAAYG